MRTLKIFYDFCKSELNSSRIIEKYIGLEKYELCEECNLKVNKIIKSFDDKYNKIKDEFDNEIKIIKGK